MASLIEVVIQIVHVVFGYISTKIITLIVCGAKIPFPCTFKHIMMWPQFVIKLNWGLLFLVNLTSWSSNSNTLKSVHLYTKRWYLVLHVARCVIISPFFSLLSLTISLAPFSHLPITFSICCFLLCPHGGASLHYFLVLFHFDFFSFFFFGFPNTTPLYSLPFCLFSCCRLSPSQCDGLSGWFLRCSWPLCKYACLSSTASLVTYVFLRLPVGFQVWNGADQTHRGVHFWQFRLVTVTHFVSFCLNLKLFLQCFTPSLFFRYFLRALSI